jgi:hypothetical protein
MDDVDLSSRKSPNSAVRSHSARQLGPQAPKDHQVLAAVVRMVVVMIVVVPAVVPIAAVLVPLVIVINMAAISVPVPGVKLLSIVVRSDPSSPLIWRPCPITVMPLIVISDRVPIAVYIRVTGTRTPGHHVNHTGTWRRTDSNAERDLRLRCRCADQQQADE